jgi:PEGA domain
MKTSYLLSLPLFFFTACATITRGVHDKLSVLSEPSGANVMLSSGERGVTPTKFVKSRRDNFTVTVSKPGYIPQTVKVESNASATGATAMAGNVLGGLIGIGVDAASGAHNSLYPNPVSVHLVPRRTSAAAEENSAERVPNRSATVASRGRREETAQTKPRPSPSPRASSTKLEFPIAKSVPDKPGYVFSPFDTSGRYVDVRGYTSGSKVKDPWSDKIFIVP